MHTSSLENTFLLIPKNRVLKVRFHSPLGPLESQTVDTPVWDWKKMFCSVGDEHRMLTKSRNRSLLAVCVKILEPSHHERDTVQHDFHVKSVKFCVHCRANKAEHATIFEKSPPDRIKFTCIPQETETPNNELPDARDRRMFRFPGESSSDPRSTFTWKSCLFPEAFMTDA